MREGRAQLISARSAAQRNLERHAKERENAELSRQIADEEQKVRNLEAWVSNSARARQVRDFIAELEKVWTQKGRDLSPETKNGQQIAWMKQQADRLDPMVPSPSSIFDRKRELDHW